MTPQHLRRRPEERSATLPLRRKALPGAGGRAGSGSTPAPCAEPRAPQPGAFPPPLTPEISVMWQLVLLQQREKGYRWEFEAQTSGFLSFST